MSLEAIALGEVLSGRKQLEVSGNVQAADLLASQRNDVIDMRGLSSAVQRRRFGVNRADRGLVGPSRGATYLGCPPLPSICRRLRMVSRAERGCLIVPAARRIGTFTNPDFFASRAAAAKGLAMVLHAKSARAHFFHPRSIPSLARITDTRKAAA